MTSPKLQVLAARLQITLAQFRSARRNHACDQGKSRSESPSRFLQKNCVWNRLNAGEPIIFLRARRTERGSNLNKQDFSMKLIQQTMALFLSWWLVPGVQASLQDGYAQAPAQALQQSPQQLQQLVAPIALYPDGLIAQILAAASYPEQVVEAEQWLEKHKHLTGDKLAKEVNKQHWDASVKGLTQFPAVLANMNQNLAWTSELGDAYVNQQQARKSGHSNHAAEGSAGRELEDHAPGERDNSRTDDSHSACSARRGLCSPIRSLAGVRVSASGLPRLVSLSGVCSWEGPGLGWDWALASDFLQASSWGWHNWGYPIGMAGDGVVYNHNTYISHSRTISQSQ